MSAHNCHQHGSQGMATLNGSVHDITPYKSTKRAEAFIAALLDPAATTIRRKNGNVFEKRRHILMYRSELATLPLSQVTADMRVLAKTKDGDDTYASVHRPVLDAKLTFHEQTSFPTSVYEGSAPTSTWKTMHTPRRINIDGKQRWNKQRDW